MPQYLKRTDGRQLPNGKQLPCTAKREKMYAELQRLSAQHGDAFNQTMDVLLASQKLSDNQLVIVEDLVAAGVLTSKCIGFKSKSLFSVGMEYSFKDRNLAVLACTGVDGVKLYGMKVEANGIEREISTESKRCCSLM